MLLYNRWHELPLHVRVLIANQFGFSKIGPTHVFDNKIQSDGYDLGAVDRALSLEALQEYTGSKSKDVEELWDLMLAKVEGREVPVVIMSNDIKEIKDNLDGTHTIVKVPEDEVAAIVSEPTELNAKPLPVTPEPKKRGPKRKSK